MSSRICPEQIWNCPLVRLGPNYPLTQITSDMGIPTVTDTQNIDPASDDKTGADPNTLLMCLLLWILWRYWI